MLLISSIYNYQIFQYKILCQISIKPKYNYKKIPSSACPQPKTPNQKLSLILPPSSIHQNPTHLTPIRLPISTPSPNPYKKSTIQSNPTPTTPLAQSFQAPPTQTSPNRSTYPFPCQTNFID